jgi:hypothetical protein
MTHVYRSKFRSNLSLLSWASSCRTALRVFITRLITRIFRNHRFVLEKRGDAKKANRAKGQTLAVTFGAPPPGRRVWARFNQSGQLTDGHLFFQGFTV